MHHKINEYLIFNEVKISYLTYSSATYSATSVRDGEDPVASWVIPGPPQSILVLPEGRTIDLVQSITNDTSKRVGDIRTCSTGAGCLTVVDDPGTSTTSSSISPRGLSSGASSSVTGCSTVAIDHGAP